MKKFLKLEKAAKFIMVILMITGIIFSTLNIFSAHSIAYATWGTQQSDGCYDEPFNCVRGHDVK